MQEKARIDNADRLQDRMEVRRMAESPDPFLKNQERYESFKERMNNIHQVRENLFKSTVLSKIVR